MEKLEQKNLLIRFCLIFTQSFSVQFSLHMKHFSGNLDVRTLPYLMQPLFYPATWPSQCGKHLQFHFLNRSLSFCVSYTLCSLCSPRGEANMGFVLGFMQASKCLQDFFWVNPFQPNDWINGHLAR